MIPVDEAKGLRDRLKRQRPALDRAGTIPREDE